MSEKIKVTLDGTAETMLQSFYARAKYSLKKGHKFYDAKAVELVNKDVYKRQRGTLLRLVVNIAILIRHGMIRF